MMTAAGRQPHPCHGGSGQAARGREGRRGCETLSSSHKPREAPPITSASDVRHPGTRGAPSGLLAAGVAAAWFRCPFLGLSAPIVARKRERTGRHINCKHSIRLLSVDFPHVAHPSHPRRWPGRLRFDAVKRVAVSSVSAALIHNLYQALVRFVSNMHAALSFSREAVSLDVSLRQRIQSRAVQQVCNDGTV